MAHKICAMHILEPLVETALDKRDRVVGIKKIPGARWSLKCSVCRLPAKIGKHKVGACIQCITGKCVRAYHVTCALLEGIPVEMADGLLVTYCSAHDPLKRQERDAKKFDSIQDRISKGSEVVARCGSFFYFGIVSSVTPGSGGCMVVFEEGE